MESYAGIIYGSVELSACDRFIHPPPISSEQLDPAFTFLLLFLNLPCAEHHEDVGTWIIIFNHAAAAAAAVQTCFYFAAHGVHQASLTLGRAGREHSAMLICRSSSSTFSQIDVSLKNRQKCPDRI